MSPSVFAQTAFHIHHEPADSILTAYWSQPAADEQAREDYGDLLAAARLHEKCRFWLIELGQRLQYGHEVYQWYAHSFAPQAVRALGHPIFVAYFTAPGQHNHPHDPAMHHLKQLCARYDYYLEFFASRAAALRWLQHQQEYDPAPGEGPAQLAE